MNQIVSLTLLALVATCALVSAWPAQQQQQQQGEQYEINRDGSIFPMAPTCKSNEKIVHGIPLEFQPTCSNRKPATPRVFYHGLVSCFCAGELVRNKAGECVALADCPKE